MLTVLDCRRCFRGITEHPHTGREGKCHDCDGTGEAVCEICRGAPGTVAEFIGDPENNDVRPVCEECSKRPKSREEQILKALFGAGNY